MSTLGAPLVKGLSAMSAVARRWRLCDFKRCTEALAGLRAELLHHQIWWRASRPFGAAWVPRV